MSFLQGRRTNLRKCVKFCFYLHFHCALPLPSHRSFVVLVDRKESLTSWKKLVHSFNLKCSFSRVVYTHFRCNCQGQKSSEKQRSSRSCWLAKSCFSTGKRNSCEKAAKLLCDYNGCNMLRLRVYFGGRRKLAGCSFMLFVLEFKPFQLHSAEARETKRN